MQEMAVTGEDHGQLPFIGCGDDFLIPHGATGLNGRRCTGFGAGDEAVGKGEHRITSHDTAGE